MVVYILHYITFGIGYMVHGLREDGLMYEKNTVVAGLFELNSVTSNDIIILVLVAIAIAIGLFLAFRPLRDKNDLQYKAILERLPTAMLLARADNYEVVFFNQRSKELFELRSNELYNLKDLLHLPDVKINDPSVLYEDRLALKGGEKVSVSIGIYKISYNKTEHFAVSLTDISSHKISIDEINEARSIADSTNRLKTEFIANMSHEMRTPMNAIIGISQMLMRQGKQNLSGKQYEGLTLIYESADRLLALINDILDLSRIESGKMEIELMPVSFEKIFTQLKNLVYTLIDKKPIRFNIKKSSNVPDYFIADYNKLLQVLINLLSNAVKFTREGKINLNVHCVSEKLYFEVTDTGIGIPSRDLDKIFDRFHQVRSKEARKQKGTGLGLALCKDFVQLMNGNIMAFSEENTGTTMSFNIPLIVVSEEKLLATEEKVTFVEEQDVSLFTGSNYKVVLIEPDKSLNSLFSQYLRNNGYEVVPVFDGVEGYRAIAEEKPHLIITELKLARWSGYDLLKRLASVETLSAIPVVLVTSVNKKPNKNAYHYTEYLQKPVSDQKLLHTIKKCLQGAKQPNIKSKILIVDDEDTNLFTLESILDNRYEVITAKGGEEALGLIGKVVPDVILLDIMMPDMNGYEVLKKLKKLKNIKNTKVIAVTASALKGDKEKILESGFDDYLSKPVDPDKVLESINQALNK